MNGITAMVAQMQATQIIRPKGADLRHEIITLSSSMSQRAVAHRLGISRTYVFNVLRQARKS